MLISIFSNFKFRKNNFKKFAIEKKMSCTYTATNSINIYGYLLIRCFYFNSKDVCM